MKVVVLGGSGFLGGFVVPRLVATGEDVVALTRSDRARARVVELGATPLAGDLDDGPALLDALASARPAVVVNLASLGFGHAPSVVAAIGASGAQHAVHVSTTAVTTRIDAPSKAVRLAAEATIEAAPTPWTILRPTMIYGAPGDRNVERLLRALRRAPVFPLPDGGRRLHQPVHVDDLARVVVAASDGRAPGARFDVAGPEPLAFRALVEASASAIGRRVPLVGIPARPVVGVLRRLEGRGLRPPVRSEQVERLLEDKAFDITPARRVLDHEPRSFADGVRAEARLLGLA